MIGKVVDWKASGALVDYEEALAFMEQRVADIVDGSAPETVWLLEHPSLYTAGTSARPDEILTPNRFPVYATGRGGRYTYHGPGQRVAYVMLDLRRRGNDIRAFVHNLEEWLILTLQRFAIEGERRQDRVGIWVQMGNGREAKIGAIGVRVRRWITFHGVALNVHPDLTHFDGIVPCGVTGHGVTSLDALGVSTTMADVDAALKATFSDVFGTTESMPSPRVAAR